ncbi:MAG: sugar transferase [Aureispira sp.]|nr:sugar transferase [Aureispira sp.]
MKVLKLPKGAWIYIVVDYLVAILSWYCFFTFRKVYIEGLNFSVDFIYDENFFYGILIVPIIWLMVYLIFDSYRNIYRMSRMNEIFRTLVTAIIGSVLLFFAIILDDLTYYSAGYKSYYTAFFSLFLIHFVLTLFGRMVVLTRSSRQIKSGKVSFKTLIIGSNTKAIEVYNDIVNRKKAIGFNFVGFITAQKDKANNGLSEYMPCLGNLSELSNILEKHNIEEVILALETSEHPYVQSTLNTLASHNLPIRVIPDMYDILLGKVKMTHVYGAVLIEISPQFMPMWVRIAKRTMDLMASIFVLILFSPLYLYVILRVKMSSAGPIFYKQERIGLNGQPFKIIKFRSMYTDAEKKGPQLSSDTDDRCTPWGKTMRKYRLDELPQFWNVIRGDMALVGPRPERQFYIDQITKRAPHVSQLHKVRPGITSWGQVKYGYASNVDEMIARLKYDILYIENLSLSLDIKILFYTVIVIIQGRGK